MSGIIFNIERFAIHDGPGIRTLVFLKGCPLRCLWCSNPEGQNREPEILFDAEKCNECGSCIKACGRGIIERIHGAAKLRIKRERCDGCGDCAKACKEFGTDALQIAGRCVSVQETMNEIVKDRIFYENSGGGVTLSGGEPLMQPEFTRSLLVGCKDAGLHTAMETTGFASFDSFRRILKSVDLVLFDIKHMDSGLHKEFTGVTNKLIIRNAERISDLNVPLIARIPVIPGYTDPAQNLERTARFIDKLNVDEVHLLPYHFFGSSKYGRLGREYKLSGLQPPDKNRMQEIKRIIESDSNLKVQIGG